MAYHLLGHQAHKWSTSSYYKTWKALTRYIEFSRVVLFTCCKWNWLVIDRCLSIFSEVGRTHHLWSYQIPARFQYRWHQQWRHSLLIFSPLSVWSPWNPMILLCGASSHCLGRLTQFLPCLKYCYKICRLIITVLEHSENIFSIALDFKYVQNMLLGDCIWEVIFNQVAVCWICCICISSAIPLKGQNFYAAPLHYSIVQHPSSPLFDAWWGHLF